MSLICRMFGHQMPNWRDYHKIAGDEIDGINRWHGYLKCECPRCGEVVSSGMVHLPTELPARLNCTKTVVPTKDLSEAPLFFDYKG